MCSALETYEISLDRMDKGYLMDTPLTWGPHNGSRKYPSDFLCLYKHQIQQGFEKNIGLGLDSWLLTNPVDLLIIDEQECKISSKGIDNLAPILKNALRKAGPDIELKMCFLTKSTDITATMKRFGIESVDQVWSQPR